METAGGIRNGARMKILVLGAAGMIGRKLVARLSADGALAGTPITALHLVDVIAPDAPAGPLAAVCEAADLSAPGAAAKLVAGRPDAIFHLAAIVSGEAEADLAKGYRVNLDGTRLLLDAVRDQDAAGAWRPRLVFSSSVAVYGGALPDVIPDDFPLTPTTSYGTQKAMGELMVSDYSRKGIVDGISLRLPTICVRPGKPNKAASGFFSGIIREPLAGQEAVLPVGEDVRHWMASPRSAVGFLIHAAGLDLSRLGTRRALALPGVSVTVGEQIEALRTVAGEAATRLIRRVPDAAIETMVRGWARGFDPARARDLGFVAESRFEDIIRLHVADELGGQIRA